MSSYRLKERGNQGKCPYFDTIYKLFYHSDKRRKNGKEDREIMLTEEKLLRGVVDFHVHVEPSFMERYCDFVELCYMAEKYGYKAIGHKDHHYGSGALAAMIKKHFFGESDLEVLGTVALNETVGGMNRMVLETNIAFGAKAVWLPTTSAANHIEFMKTKAGGFPTASKGPACSPKPVYFTDENGDLNEETVKMFEVIRDHPGVALGSGHGTPAETDAMVRKAVELGIQDRFFVDHPYGIILAPWDDIIRWARQGVMIEFVAGMTVGPDCALTLEEMAHYIKEIGPERCIILSDLGQKNAGNPVERYGAFLMDLHRAGVSEDDIRMMTSHNPGKMIGIV